MLAGEWAVLELGNPCIVMAIEKGITVTAVPSKTNFVHESIFVQNAMDVVSEYLGQKKQYALAISSEISQNGCKFGFGSSAAVVVATIKALLQFHNHDIDSEQANKIIFKLSCIAHYRAQKNMGSCFDVAASTFGGVLVYKRFDPVWLEKKLHAHDLRDVVACEWPCLEITPITLPPRIKITTVFSGQSANTRELVQQMFLFKKNNKKIYDEICEKIAHVVKKLILAIEQKNCDKILSLITQNRILLQELSEKSGLNLETNQLKKICDDAESQGCAAKLSGAGGGDCAIILDKCL